MKTVLCFQLVWAATAWCATPPPAVNAPVKQRSDAAIEADIRARFQRSKIRVEGFTVRVQGGVATIEGKTKVIQRKGTATRLARLGGAKAVVNKIEIDEAARQKASENLAQGRRRAQVKRGEVRSEAREP
jgi:hypothetical protein